MIPLKLSIEGLYSYQKAQTIDFTRLTAAGLFGIFGAVGSGKSSILEAISFALYGETERLKKSDKRNYNMMNLRSNNSSIDFEFLNFEQKKYKIVRTFKRNSKNFDDVKPKDTILYQCIDDKWVPQESTNVEPILGNLSYENFKRTIIIPQGQFKEFLELGATERTKMLKDIFNLHQFDLQQKTATLLKSTQSDLDNLKGQLIGFDNISEENILLLKSDFEKENNDLKIAKNVHQAIAANVLELKLIKDDFNSLNQKKNHFQQLKIESPKIEAQEQQLLVYEKTFLLFDGLLKQIEINTKDIQSKDLQLVDTSKNLEQLQEKSNQLLEELKIVKVDYDNLDKRKEELYDLNLIKQILELKEKAISRYDSLLKGEQFVNEQKANIDSLNEFISHKIEVLNQLKASKPDTALLLKLDEWYNENDKLKERKNDLLQRIQLLNLDFEPQKLKIDTYNIDIKNYEKDLNAEIVLLENQIDDCRNQLTKYQIQKQMAQYVHTIHDGAACPLCGSIEHPNVLQIDDVTESILDLNTKIDNNKLSIKKLNETKNDISKLLVLQSKFTNQISDLNIELTVQNDLLAKHLSAFEWSAYDANSNETLKAEKRKLLTLENEITIEENLLHEKKNEEIVAQTTLQNAYNKLENYKIELAKITSQIELNTENLKQLNFDNYQNLSVDIIEQSINNLNASIKAVELKYLQLTEVANSLTTKIASLASHKNSIVERIDELKILDNKNKLQLNKLLAENNYENYEEVLKILDQQLDIISLRSIVNAFKVELKTLENQITDLTLKLNDKSFDAEFFKEQENKLLQSENFVAMLTKSTTQLSTEILRIENEYSKKKILINKLEEVQNRAENLNVLKRMFDAAGFVEYVSAIYLRQLCDMANTRFHRLTRNQLSLQLNKNYDFEIIDFLNEGKSRSVKTLSGGQSFQVSLCLALALAESVQSNAKAVENFFFIDEGFGTQDSASVNIVFETLRNLQKENKIVGIISHVDDLKDKIPVSLSVFKDEEKGSIINEVLG